MQVILLERVENLGSIGDEVKVRDGYARNFLLPNKKALRANDSNRKVFEGRRAELEARNAESKAAAEKASGKIDGARPKQGHGGRDRQEAVVAPDGVRHHRIDESRQEHGVEHVGDHLAPLGDGAGHNSCGSGRKGKLVEPKGRIDVRT